MGSYSASARRGIDGMSREDAIQCHEDKSDLFDFCCALVSRGALATWWDSYPVESLPHGGRPPESPEEAQEFMRHTRALAIQMGLWAPL